MDAIIREYVPSGMNVHEQTVMKFPELEQMFCYNSIKKLSWVQRGKGNPDWNCSAPHGAGRLLSRTGAHNSLSLDEYQRQMQGIYSTCVCEETIDESPMAYKSIDEIMRNITPTVEIIKQIKPIYNFKAIS